MKYWESRNSWRQGNSSWKIVVKVFPILVVLAYLADINVLFCCKRPEEDQEGTIGYSGGKNQENMELIASQNGTSDAKLVQQFMVQQKATGEFTQCIVNKTIIYLGDLDEEQAASAIAQKLQGPKKSHSRAYYRVQARLSIRVQI